MLRVRLASAKVQASGLSMDSPRCARKLLPLMCRPDAVPFAGNTRPSSLPGDCRQNLKSFGLRGSLVGAAMSGGQIFALLREVVAAWPRPAQVCSATRSPADRERTTGLPTNARPAPLENRRQTAYSIGRTSDPRAVR